MNIVYAVCKFRSAGFGYASIVIPWVVLGELDFLKSGKKKDGNKEEVLIKCNVITLLSAR